jgi:nucleolar protein 12
VTRAKNITKTTSYSNKDTKGPRPSKDKIFNPKASSQSQSMAGRAGKLLGRAGAAQARKADGPPGIHKSPEDVVFEGHRARSSQGKGTIFGKSKKQGKPTNRSSRRGAAFKASGRKN